MSSIAATTAEGFLDHLAESHFCIADRAAVDVLAVLVLLEIFEAFLQSITRAAQFSLPKVEFLREAVGLGFEFFI
jgi:hypothetical protein